MTTELQPGDKVRVKPLSAIGTILRVSERLHHTPYLVQIPGYGERGYAAADLELLPVSAPPSAPVVAVRAGQVLKCGACGSLNMSSSACRQCGTPWRLP